MKYPDYERQLTLKSDLKKSSSEKQEMASKVETIFSEIEKGSVFENDCFGRRFNFWLGVLDFKTATKLFL